jgi:hypothetical protein
MKPYTFFCIHRYDILIMINDNTVQTYKKYKKMKDIFIETSCILYLLHSITKKRYNSKLDEHDRSIETL